MISPGFYYLFAMALIGATLAVVFYLAWHTQDRKSHALTWAMACAAMTVQWSVCLGEGFFPNQEVYWITLNAAGLVVMSLWLKGHSQRTQKRLPPGSVWPYAAAVIAAIAWFTFVSPHVGLQIGLLPVAAAAALFLSSTIVIRHTRHPRPAEWAAAISMSVFGAAQLVAAGAAMMQGAAGDPGYSAVYQSINLVSLPIGYIGVSVFAIFMLASDLSDEMKEIAVRDQLTGLLNRRGFSEQSERAYATARRSQRPVSVIMTDIDRFKRINDELGHAAGDQALRHIGGILEQNRRAEDILARMGGEEFALVLPGCDVAESLRIANILCRSLESHKLHVGIRPVTITASFGVATISDRDTCLTDIIVRADKALFKSKRAGRNRVELDSSQVIMLSKESFKRDSA